MNFIRALRRLPEETSTAPTPSEPSDTALVIEGHNVSGAGLTLAPNAPGIQLKEACEYYKLLKENIEFLGGEGEFEVKYCNPTDGTAKLCVVRHWSFGIPKKATFEYNAVNLKNHWLAFNLKYLEKKRVLDYFEWLQDNQIASGREGEVTPLTLIKKLNL